MHGQGLLSPQIDEPPVPTPDAIGRYLSALEAYFCQPMEVLAFGAGNIVCLFREAQI